MSDILWHYTQFCKQLSKPKTFKHSEYLVSSSFLIIFLIGFKVSQEQVASFFGVSQGQSGNNSYHITSILCANHKLRICFHLRWSHSGICSWWGHLPVRGETGPKSCYGSRPLNCITPFDGGMIVRQQVAKIYPQPTRGKVQKKHLGLFFVFVLEEGFIFYFSQIESFDLCLEDDFHVIQLCFGPLSSPLATTCTWNTWWWGKTYTRRLLN